MSEDKVLGHLEKQREILSDIQVNMAKVEVDLRHHVQGTIQNREALRIFQKEFQAHRDLVEKRFDLVEQQNTERMAIERGQAKVFKGASIGLGLIATVVGIIFTVSRFL